jgi:prepilin-type N-terminal cleavage/methylation domain-containing protein
MKKGFTLIELLVVIAVIGILATIVLSGLSPVTDSAKDTRAKTAMNQIRLEAHNYAMRQPSPGTFNGFCTQLTTSGTNAQRLAADIQTNTGVAPTCSAAAVGATTNRDNFCVIATLNEMTGTVNNRVCADKNVIRTATTTIACTAAHACP